MRPCEHVLLIALGTLVIELYSKLSQAQLGSGLKCRFIRYSISATVDMSLKAYHSCPHHVLPMAPEIRVGVQTHDR